MPKPKLHDAMGKDGKMDWMKQTRFDFHFAKRCLFEQGGVAPMFIVHGDEMVPILATYRTPDEKLAVHQIVRLVCMAENAFGISFVGEAWMAKPMPDDPDPEYPAVPPRDREDKREIIMAQIIFRTDDGSKGTFMSANIDRGEDGKVSGVSNEMTSEPTMEFRGSFAHLLPPNAVSPAAQEAARALVAQLAKNGSVKFMGSYGRN